MKHYVTVSIVGTNLDKQIMVASIIAKELSRFVDVAIHDIEVTKMDAHYAMDMLELNKIPTEVVIII